MIRIITYTLIIIPLCLALMTINVHIVTAKLFWELWDPFPGYEMIGEYRIYGVTYLSQIWLRLDDLFGWYGFSISLAFIRSTNKSRMINTCFFLVFGWTMLRTFVGIEYLYNYNKSPWEFRMLLLLISAIITIGYNMVRNENKNMV